MSVRVFEQSFGIGINAERAPSLGGMAPFFRFFFQKSILFSRRRFRGRVVATGTLSAAGAIALRKGESTDYLGLQATYLRPPNAQKNKKLLEAMGHE